MTERPIIFSGPMVRVILDGTKTQTRRVLKAPAWVSPDDMLNLALQDPPTGLAYYVDGQPRKRWNIHYRPGDLLWVRETFDFGIGYAGESQVPIYKASTPEWTDKWRSPIHMPRWASRVTLRVTDVRVERIQEISGYDCVAEGVWKEEDVALGRSAEAIGAFAALWDSIHAKHPERCWAANPWVVAITFERVES